MSYYGLKRKHGSQDIKQFNRIQEIVWVAIHTALYEKLVYKKLGQRW